MYLAWQCIQIDTNNIEHMKLHQGEKRIAVFRKHWFYIAIEIVMFAILAIMPYVLLNIYQTYVPTPLPDRLLPYLHLFLSVWTLFIWIGLFISISNYCLDLWILTNERLVDVEQRSLFSRSVATLQIDKIQDVTIKTSGVLEELLSIGHVSVQTAGADREFQLPHMANPELVKEKILSATHAKNNEVRAVRLEK